MTDAEKNEEPGARTSEQEKRPWLEPEVSEAKSLIGYPDGLILQGASGTEP